MRVVDIGSAQQITTMEPPEVETVPEEMEDGSPVSVEEEENQAAHPEEDEEEECRVCRGPAEEG